MDNITPQPVKDTLQPNEESNKDDLDALTEIGFGTSTPSIKPWIRTDAAKSLGMALFYLLFFRFSMLISSGQMGVVILTTLFSLPLLLLFTVYTARAICTKRSLLINFISAGIATVPMVAIPIFGGFLANNFGEKAIFRIYKFYVVLFHNVPGLQGILLIWMAVVIGVAVARLVREINMLLPISIALAAIDLYAVFGGGVVSQAIHKQSPTAERAMQALTVKLPTSHPNGGAAPMQLAVGFADFLFIALFFSCFQRFRIPSKRILIALCVLLIGYMAVVALYGLALPALVPIAIVMIGMNIRRFKYKRDELFALLYAGVICSAVAGIYFFMHRAR